MTSASDLFALQEIDLQRDARRAILADIDARIGETEELFEARDNVEDSAAALDRLRKRQRDFETQLQDLDAKIGPVEKKLYDGSVRNPKELTDLQRDLDMLKAQRNKLDDQGLALMESVDSAAKALDAAKLELQNVEAGWKREQEDLAATRARVEAESVHFEGQRKQRTKGMDMAALGRYESLRSTKQGRAVAKVERGTCLGCRISLPTHLTQRVRAGIDLVQCPSCERILVAG
jgi:predicted  nucleic acid-binding Zn-ribbon protein